MKISQKMLTEKSLGFLAHSERNTAGRILRYFALETNIEGINNAGRSRSLARAAVWLGVFLVLVALTISDMTELVKGISPSKLMPLKALTAEYTDQPVDVSTTLEHENAVDFPSVTVCNKNRVSCRRLRLMIQHCHVLPQVTRGHLAVLLKFLLSANIRQSSRDSTSWADVMSPHSWSQTSIRTTALTLSWRSSQSERVGLKSPSLRLSLTFLTAFRMSTNPRSLGRTRSSCSPFSC